MAQFCPHCDVVLTHHEAFEKRCHACGQEFAEADERGSVAAAHAHPAGAFGSSRHCRFCGREGAVDPCYLLAVRVAVHDAEPAPHSVQRLNLRCDACPWCRFRINLYGRWAPGLIFVAALLIAAGIAFGTGPAVAALGLSPDAVALVSWLSLVAAPVAALAFVGVCLLLWRRRLRRLMGEELDGALRAVNRGRWGYRVAMAREIPAAEPAVPLGDFLEQS